MPIDQRHIDPYLRELCDSIGSAVTDGIVMSVGLWIFTADGRQVGVRIIEHPDRIELSDAEETWSDLSKAGAFDCLSRSDLDRFNARAGALCIDYRVVWTGKAIVWTGPRSEWVDAAKRICAVSLAIDSWRHWMEYV